MTSASEVFPHRVHEVDFCVVGGGMAGLVASLSAARHGARVVLMQDRPVLGGNASSECRVHITGADRAGGISHMRETGILEEIRLENIRRNPNKSWSVWDTLLYEKAKAEETLTLLLNCSCQDAQMEGDRIVSVTGWQLTTQTRHTVRARIFADCSGDAILAPLTGAEFRIGREAREQYQESLAPEESDDKTMGMTCWFQAREHGSPQAFDPPEWAYRFESCDELPYGEGGHNQYHLGYWWMELGGETDTVHGTEDLRDELLKVVYGVWDHIKNHCAHREEAENWALDWINFVPAKRESRRYVGEHVLCQGEVELEGRFEDVVAYGGWTMDDHHPSGFWSAQRGVAATQFHHSPSPFGIPYRCLYSRNIDNLMFAGRCHSATHMAMSSTRVMGTGSVMGQAVGTAGAIAAREGIDPAAVGQHMEELQQTLLRNDSYLPGVGRKLSRLTTEGTLRASQGDPEPVRDGVGRQEGEDPHCWLHSPGDWVAYEFDGPRAVKEVSLILDTAMETDIQMHMTHSPPGGWRLPRVLPRRFALEGLVDGQWQVLRECTDNIRRNVRVPVGREVGGIRYRLEETRGAEESRLYAFYVQ
jgi:hypothetical protein